MKFRNRMRRWNNPMWFWRLGRSRLVVEAKIFPNGVGSLIVFWILSLIVTDATNWAIDSDNSISVAHLQSPPIVMFCGMYITSLVGTFVHEMGHAIVQARFGNFRTIYIRMKGYGAMTVGLGGRRRLSRSQDAVKSLAGPTANVLVAIALQLIVVGLVLAGFTLKSSDTMTVLVTVQLCAFLQLVNGMFNMLPIPNFDGYNLLKTIFGRSSVQAGMSR